MNPRILLGQLLPNPFRSIFRPYPIVEQRVEALAESIRTTGFWDNLIVRRGVSDTTGIVYQIAYGHHRLAALQLLTRQGLLDENFELELPVRILADAAMVRIMVTENSIDLDAVGAVLTHISQGTGIPTSEIEAEDICSFVGANWWGNPKVKKLLNKIFHEGNQLVPSALGEPFDLEF